MIVVKPGTKVITVIGGVKAMITGICIREQSVSYEMSWYSGNSHQSSWIYRYEFEIDTTIKQSAGLKSWDVPQSNSDECTVRLLTE